MISVLKTVEAGLSSREFVPIFTCFCFSDGAVTAYDDLVAIRCPANVGLEGGIRGSLLLGYLNKSRAKEITMVQGDEEVLVKAGNSRLRVPVLPVSDFVFEWPDEADARDVEALPELVEALRLVTIAMGTDPNEAWRCGICLDFSVEGTVRLYAADAFSGATMDVACEHDGGSPVVLPPKLVKLVTSYGKRSAVKAISLLEGGALVRFADKTTMYARTIPDAKTEFFEEVFARIASKEMKRSVVPLPRSLQPALDRLMTPLDAVKEKMVLCTCADGRLLLDATTDQGRVKEGMKAPEHPDVSVGLSPSLLLRAIPSTSHFLLTESGVLMVGEDGFVYVAGVVEA